MIVRNQAARRERAPRFSADRSVVQLIPRPGSPFSRLAGFDGSAGFETLGECLEKWAVLARLPRGTVAVRW
jgi:hypothetical protein